MSDHESFIEWIWLKFLERAGCNDLRLFVYGSYFIHIVVYWITGGIFLYLNNSELINRFLGKNKTQSHKTIDEDQVIKTSVQVIFNQIFVSLPALWMCGRFRKWLGTQSVKELPNLKEVVFAIILCSLSYSLISCMIHRTMHLKFFYEALHKRHHEWNESIPISAYYVHPLEHVICNIVAPLTGVFLLRTHVVINFIWLIIFVIYSQLSGCGHKHLAGGNFS